MFRFRRAAFYFQFKSKVGNILAKATAMRVNLDIDDAPIASRSRTHAPTPKASRVLSTPFSLGIPFPRFT
jgi:hypothetical protein